MENGIIISICALTVSIVALSVTIRNYLRKSGINVRGQYSLYSSAYCQDKYIGSIVLENSKDRPVVIFKIFLLVGRNYYVELENFEKEPKILKPYEVYSNQFDPVDFYSVNMRRVILDDLLDSKKIKPRLILSTSNGRYEVSERIKRWDPISDFFNNHMTAVIRPMRSTYKNICFGSEVKFILDLKMENGKEEVIPIYPYDFEIRRFRKFDLTKDCLESKEKLESFLLEKAMDGMLSCTNIIVHDVSAWKKEVYSEYSNNAIQARYIGWFKYFVVGRIFTKFSNIRLYFLNRRNARFVSRNK